MKGRKRCRMHGGTNPGAPKGNQRALKHGLYSHEVQTLKRLLASVSQPQAATE